jgi:uncharacterized Fe-S cluster protein YjdI
MANLGCRGYHWNNYKGTNLIATFSTSRCQHANYAATSNCIKESRVVIIIWDVSDLFLT